jgi:hypothetical protein
MSCFSVHCIVLLLYELVVERCFAERPEQSQGSRFVAGDSFTLDCGRAVSAMGFEREAMRGLKRGENKEA